MRNLIPIKIASTLVLMTPTISFNAHADSKAMRKKEPRIFAVTAVGSAEGILETSLGYSFGQAFELSLAIGQGRENLEKDFTKDFTLAEGTFLYGGTKELLQAKINSRIFLGNSFYFVFGTGGRRSTNELGVFDTSFLWHHHASLKTESIVASVGIGNQWTFDSGLMLGMDWAVVSKSIYRTETLSHRSNGLGEEQIRNLNEAMSVWLREIGQVPKKATPAIHIGFRF